MGPWGRAGRALALAAGLAMLAAGGVAAQQFDGAWAGATSQEQAISFSVVNNALTSLTVSFTLEGTNCTSSSTIFVDLSSAPAGIVGNQFFVSGVATGIEFTVSGFFQSPVAASGGLVARRLPGPGCVGLAGASWLAGPTLPTSLVAAVLPSSRSVQVGQPATAFATILNTGLAPGIGCRIALPAGLPVAFAFQTTSPVTNQPTGPPDVPVDIPVGGAHTFVVSLTPLGPIAPTDVPLIFDCTNTVPAPVIPGVNTLLLTASTTPVPDVVALAATPTGTGIVAVPLPGTGVFAVATVNLGAAAPITVSADTGTVALPVNVGLCQTDPATGACLGDVAPAHTVSFGANETPTFGVFVTAAGPVPLAPAVNRIFVRFRDAAGVVRGSTSVAVQAE